MSIATRSAPHRLAASVKLGLEGIVSKKRDQPYISSRNGGWVKCETAVWRQANKGGNCFRSGSLGTLGPPLPSAGADRVCSSVV
jgi:hypothetical protein